MPRIRRFVQVQTSGAKARNFQSLTAGLKACSTLGLTGSAEECRAFGACSWKLSEVFAGRLQHGLQLSNKHKIPPPCSRADESARSLTVVGMTSVFGVAKTTVAWLPFPFVKRRRPAEAGV